MSQWSNSTAAHHKSKQLSSAYRVHLGAQARRARKRKDDQSVGSFRPTTGSIVLVVGSPDAQDQEADSEQHRARGRTQRGRPLLRSFRGIETEKKTAMVALSR